MAVVRIDISKRAPFADGEVFGRVGSYEYLQGTAHFAVDPLHPRNAVITDLEPGATPGGRHCGVYGRLRHAAACGP